MEIINNRYRIVECIKQNRVVSSYVVNDIIKNYDTVQLNIINSEYIQKGLIEFYTKEFISLTNLNCKNIMSVYDFALVKLIDNKKLDERVYFYTNENVIENSNILELARGKNSEEVLDLFIEICQSINYLHLKGFVYSDINLSNIIVQSTLDKKKYNVKFKDFATIELEKQEFFKGNIDQNYFKAPEILRGEKSNVLSDIYSLGILLFVIYIKSKGNNIDFNEEIKDINQDKLNGIFNNNKDLNIKFKSIIEKMINSDPKKRYTIISQLVIDINTIFGTNYMPHRKEEVEKLNFNLKMVGKEDEVNKIINIYDSIKNKNGYNSAVLVHGESGIGKTRFLKRVKYIFSLNKVNVYKSFLLDDSTKNSNKAFIEILKQFISEATPEVLERYESELAKFIPELGDNKNIIHSKLLSGEKEKFRLINRAAGFIEECVNNTPIVIIIDNLHLSDDFTIELLEYLIRNKLPNKNIMFIMSYCDGECILNKKFTQFTKLMSVLNGATNIFLKELSEVEVGIMIQDILSTPNIPYKLADRIYDKTKGNPLFVQEIIKNFFNERYIYVDQQKGSWTRDYEYSEFVMPTDMYQILLSQVSEMGKFNINILKTISIFESGVSLAIIEEFIGNSDKDLERGIKGLISSGILCKKIEDRGFVFGFYNKFLKSLMYEKISDEDRKGMHKLASVLLENLYCQGGTEYIEELIYHLEKSNQQTKIIDYCIQNAENMKILKNRSDAIKNLTKAVSIIDYELESVKNIKVIMELAGLNHQEGNIDLAVYYYLLIEQYSENTKSYKYIIDSLIKVAEIELSKNNIEKTIFYIEKINVLLGKVDYTLGRLRCQGILASVYDISQEYGKVQTICNSCIKECIGEYKELYIIFYHHIGKAYLRSGRESEALDIFERNIELCNKYNNISLLIKSINNLGVIYGDYYQDDKKALKYFIEMKDICEKNNMSTSEVDALINIAATYAAQEQYETSLQYFIETLEKCKKYEYEFHTFYCYTSIASVYLKLDDYNNAYKYYKLCRNELLKYPIQGKDIGEFYFLASDINYRLGDLQKAQLYINKALKLYENDKSIFKWKVMILNEFIEIRLRKNDDDLKGNIKNIIDIASKITSKSNRLNIFYDVIIFLYEDGKKGYVYSILSEVNKIDLDINGCRVYIKKLYVDGLIEKNMNIKLFKEALKYSQKYKEIDICWRIYTAIADDFFEKKDYFYAVIYYFEACCILKDINIELPIAYRLSYIKLNNALKPFEKFLGINNYYKSNRNNSILKFEPANVCDEKSLLYLLEQVNPKDILKNKNFIKSIRKVYPFSLHEDIHDINDVLENLQSDNTKNLELIIDYLSYITLATRGTIIMNDNNKGYKVIASSDRSHKLPQNLEISAKILSVESPVLVTDVFLDQDINIIHNNLKAYICIPIVMENSNERDYMRNERRKNSQSSKHVIGYIYIESQRVLNNLNNDSMKECMELSKVVGIIIEKYKLRLSASIDKLTGTLTRKYLEEELDEQIEVTSLSGSKFSLIMYDLDYFKMVNDKFGHRTGDYVLKRVCQVVMDNLRETDIVGRYGGEEFIVILPDTDISGAELVAEKLRNKISGEKILDDRRDITVSLGIIECPLHGEWQGEILERVDQALYVAKQRGRNRCVVWDSEFLVKAKKTDRLAGIISGDEIQDHRKVLAMIELIEIISKSETRESKIYSLLGRIIEITESRNGILFVYDNKNITGKYSRKIFESGWTDSDMYNKNIIKSVTDTKQGVCKIDWDTIIEYDVITGVPNWQSVIAVPLIKSEVVKGVIYLTQFTKAKEFGFDDVNFVNTLGKIIVPIL
ncbi:MAG: diguanylate cyclase [Clostridium sp.]|uniref:diguanylate cyclase n=1 Tax=Clostridium sp. TaxID=1506 RepID=UPI003D6D185D